MKRKLSCLLIFSLILASLAVLPVSAYVRISYGVDCLAKEAELIKASLRGGDITFAEVDFKQALGVSRISSVTVLSLPPATDGTLKLKGVPLVSGQVLSREEIGALTFTPAGDKLESSSFTFCVNTEAGTTALTCTLRMADRINYAPSAVEGGTLYVQTQKNITVYGQMRATDPEGDALSYLVISYPTKGTLSVIDRETGEFRYTPRAGMTGRDSFTYVARDAYGNYSYPATVSLTVNKNGSLASYADMKGDPAHHAALVLAERKILLGSLEGAGMYFHPEQTVTRGEFLVMAMKAAGISPAAGVEKSWFDDDASIPDPIRPYVATAQLYGYVNGSFDGTGLYFYPNEAISRAEAAVILYNLSEVSTPTVLPVFADATDIPVWARMPAAVLCAAGIFETEDGKLRADDDMTRAECAAALYAMMEYQN